MKKAYVAPTVEKVEFQYEKVVAASTFCGSFNGRNSSVPNSTDCEGGNQIIEILK